jgi:hypothetical protein
MSGVPAPSLSTSAIASALGPLAVRFDVDVLERCESTNTELTRLSLIHISEPTRPY